MHEVAAIVQVVLPVCRNTGPRDRPVATSPDYAESTASENALPQTTPLVTSPEHPTPTLIGNTQDDRAGDPHEASNATAGTVDLLPPYTLSSTVDQAYSGVLLTVQLSV